MSIFCKKISILTLCVLIYFLGYAQRMDFVVDSESTIFLKAIYNEDKKNNIEIFVDGASVGTIAAGGSLRIAKSCHRFVKAVNPVVGTKELWRSGNTADEWKRLHPVEPDTIEHNDVTPKEEEMEVTRKIDVTSVENRMNVVPVDIIVSRFKESLEKDSFYSSAFVQAFKHDVAKHRELMSSYMEDNDAREDYVTKYKLREIYEDKENLIFRMENGIDSYIGNFIATNYKTNELSNRTEYETKLRNIIEEKISERKDILDDFRAMISEESLGVLDGNNWFSGESVIINVGVAVLVVCILVLIVLFVTKANKKNKMKRSNVEADAFQQDIPTNIVVRRKTTSILKKQSLEDVLHNDSYIKIDSSDFCADSAVRRIYLKNTCIKDIYNLYAEDLRNPNNPREDGCMVLGRWVHDEQNDEYYVSLEEIIKPGDDAVFKEYELNFGGKIKLKVSEKLRKLRRDTNLQYDMTCWVHSHPGLGVFFSNADSSVQMQLKHPTHPKFLTAIVIDILTPDQELGIFTFKHDMSINSKADLKRLYSLEELHKWAVESDRTTFKPEDYRNIMHKATKRIDSHYGIELSNSAIIDMCQLQTEQDNGLLAWVHGYVCNNSQKTEYVMTSVSKEMNIPDNELIGCYINGFHCSMPTIRRMVSDKLKNIRFILFYSTSEDFLTAIPIIDGQLSFDENTFGEEKLEELKIWTRRKR